MVEFENQSGNVEFGYCIRYAEFTAAGTAESHVDQMKIQFAGDDRGIDETGASRGTAVRDGGTVEYDRFSGFVRSRRFECASRNKPDRDCGDGAVIGKIKGAVVTGTVGGQVIAVQCFEFIRSGGDGAVSAEAEIRAGTGVKVEAVAAAPVVAVEDFGESCADADCRGVCAEADHFPGALHTHRVAARHIALCGDIQRKTAAPSFPVDIRKTFQNERGGKSVMKLQLETADFP